MLRGLMLIALVGATGPGAFDRPVPGAAVAGGPNYTADGELKLPAEYREWVFLTTGLDMSYNPGTPDANHSMFDNVFVNPAAYKVFVKTGSWPEGTMIALEHRGAEGNRSINKQGKTQSLGVMGLELHVKDSSHAPAGAKGGWAFYAMGGGSSAKAIPAAASCYSCHEQHAAVDTTFVQFYPTLLGVAKEKGVLSAEYLKEMNAAK